MKIEDALPLAQSCGGLLIPKTELHFVDMMKPTAKRHMMVDGKVAYQGHKWTDALSRIPTERREIYLDIGAHAALWAWFVAPHFERTMAIEAAPLHAALFRANISLDKWDVMQLEPYPIYEMPGNDRFGFIQLHECAVGAECGTISIECAADETGSAHVAQGGGGDKRKGHAELITYSNIPMLPLDDMDFIGRVDFVKIDVEGYELNVIKGGEKFFKSHKPWMVVEQKGNDTIYGDAKDAAVDLLKSWGWKDEKVISGDHCMSPPE